MNDHLDYNSIRDLTEKSNESIDFVVPLGLADWLRTSFPKMEDRHNIVELDWHETTSFISISEDDEKKKKTKSSLEVTAVPMQHWSSRRGYDRDKTLWCGFSLCSRTISDDQEESSSTVTTKALFPGDTGWFEGLYDIGAKYGPYDVAMIPIGAYEPYDFMEPQHNNPSDAVKMMQAVQARRSVPIHWGTIQLTTEHCMEPPQLLKQCMETSGLDPSHFSICLIGETVVVDKYK